MAVGLRIHDSELAELLIGEPYLRYSESSIPTLAKSEIWSAPTATEWVRRLKRQNEPGGDSRNIEKTVDRSAKTSSLTAYVMLEGITSSIIEHRALGSLGGQTSQILESLIRVHSQHLRSEENNESDVFSLLALWHCAFVSLFADINRIELAVGREGFDESQKHTEYVREWAKSADGSRCALHATRVLQNVENLAIGVEPAIHVPRLVYRSALIWYAYTKYGKDDPSAPQMNLDFPELFKAGFNGRMLLFEANGFKLTRPATEESSTLCCLVDLLKRVGHWGISRRMSSLMMLLVHGSSPELEKNAL